MEEIGSYGHDFGRGGWESEAFDGDLEFAFVLRRERIRDRDGGGRPLAICAFPYVLISFFIIFFNQLKPN